MPYLGNTAGNRFVASKAATQFSGNGSTTAFTLDHAVGSDEDILVSVDGVIQEPSVAYAVSNGTTLTFTAAPSNNSGNNIFVYYLFRTVGTVDHPTTSSLQATDGTFTADLTVDTSTLKVDSTNNRVGVGTASPSDPLHVTASSGSRMARFEASQANSFIAFKDSNTNVMPTIGCTTDALELKTASSGDPVLGLKIDANGHVTKPLNPMFNASEASTRSNMGINTTINMNFDQITDVNGDYADDPGTFTAPVTGKYLLTVTLVMLQVDTDYTSVEVIINTSNRNYSNVIGPAVFDQDATYWSMTTTAVADMDANDTAIIQFASGGGAEQLDISASSHYSGCLIS